MIGDNKEVYFGEFCRKCKYLGDAESDLEKPCFECLEHPFNQDSHRPINYEPAED